MLKGFQNIVCQHLQKSNLCYEFRIWYLEGFNCIHNCQDQEELIMMMDFKDGAQRVISNSSSTTWEDLDKNLIVCQVRQRRRELGKQDQWHFSIAPSLHLLSLSSSTILQSYNSLCENVLVWIHSHSYSLKFYLVVMRLCSLRSFCKFGWETLFLIALNVNQAYCPVFRNQYKGHWHNIAHRFS